MQEVEMLLVVVMVAVEMDKIIHQINHK
jgi:hypothetical protein